VWTVTDSQCRIKKIYQLILTLDNFDRNQTKTNIRYCTVTYGMSENKSSKKANVVRTPGGQKGISEGLNAKASVSARNSQVLGGAGNPKGSIDARQLNGKFNPTKSTAARNTTKSTSTTTES